MSDRNPSTDGKRVYYCDGCERLRTRLEEAERERDEYKDKVDIILKSNRIGTEILDQYQAENATLRKTIDEVREAVKLRRNYYKDEYIPNYVIDKILDRAKKGG